MPFTINPTTVENPEIPFDKALIYLAISPIIQGGDIEGALSVRVVPYRKINNKIETREDKAISINSGSVFADSAVDPVLAQAVTTISTALQTYLAAKGL